MLIFLFLCNDYLFLIADIKLRHQDPQEEFEWSIEIVYQFVF